MLHHGLDIGPGDPPSSVVLCHGLDTDPGDSPSSVVLTVLCHGLGIGPGDPLSSVVLTCPRPMLSLTFNQNLCKNSRGPTTRNSILPSYCHVMFTSFNTQVLVCVCVCVWWWWWGGGGGGGGSQQGK